ncbi:hypothetical protein ANO14919_141370 [Xylariales sp. No.14919]|nr:hypothetical protein ANO14919_141370 [Xylariales sp. No.14919]
MLRWGCEKNQNLLVQDVRCSRGMSRLCGLNQDFALRVLPRDVATEDPELLFDLLVFHIKKKRDMAHKYKWRNLRANGCCQDPKWVVTNKLPQDGDGCFCMIAAKMHW